MANLNGTNPRYDNSDKLNRDYDLSGEVVMKGVKAEQVRNIEIVRNSIKIGGGNINGITSGMLLNSNFYFANIPVSSYKTAFSAMIDFV